MGVLASLLFFFFHFLKIRRWRGQAFYPPLYLFYSLFALISNCIFGSRFRGGGLLSSLPGLQAHEMESSISYQRKRNDDISIIDRSSNTIFATRKYCRAAWGAGSENIRWKGWCLWTTISVILVNMTSENAQIKSH
jgi:hypothetical protein